MSQVLADSRTHSYEALATETVLAWVPQKQHLTQGLEEGSLFGK